MQRLARSFAETYATAASELRDLMTQERLDDAIRLAHSLKGASASLELQGVAATSARIEAALGRTNVDETHAHLPDLAVHLEHAIAALRTLAPNEETETQAAHGHPCDPAAVTAATALLNHAIARRSLSARQAFDRYADAIGLDDQARADHPLRQALGRFDFVEAQDWLELHTPAQDAGDQGLSA